MKILFTLILPLLAMVVEAAERGGQDIYNAQCTSCHSSSLRGSAHGAALIGAVFTDKWQNRDASELYEISLSQMPPGESHTLSPEDHASVVRFIVLESAAALEGTKLLASLDALGTTSSQVPDAIEFAAAVSIMDIARNMGQFNNQSVADFRPVTEAELSSPNDGDWLNWRRTRDGHAHSPLTAINRDNVHTLKLSWSMAMHKGSNQGTPIVRDGVMFLTHANNKIQALNASNGDLIWEYQYEFPKEARLLGGPTRNIAIYQEKLFLATYDAAIVAISAATGRPLWRTEKADYREAYTHSAGPIIANGIVVSGINGCEFFTEDGCFITGHDPDTGKELWRTSTLALPGTPEYATWGDIEPDRRGGGDVWISGSYDAALNLVFFGTSQPKPWAAVSRGMSVDDAALYTNSTIALNPNTGAIAWYFQHIPGETIDMEVGFERILADINGEKTVLTVGKDGILWKLNRQTGDYIALHETMDQNIFDVDKATGQLTYRPDIANAQIGESFTVCPGIYGGHNWQSASYDANQNMLFLPLHQLCSTMTPRKVDLQPGGGGYGADVATYPIPGKERMAGKLVAVNALTMTEKWAIEQEALFLSGSVVTDGGLLFIGDLDRRFRAINTDTGETLWSTRLPAPAHGYPVTYSADGRQFVAIPTGIGVFRALTAAIFPDIYQPPDGQGIYVFELIED